jgi:hypothetical protein
MQDTRVGERERAAGRGGGRADGAGLGRRRRAAHQRSGRQRESGSAQEGATIHAATA